ncbi:hypothetical protein I3843_09G110200 [Carya illinoinensis]|uniref:Uncharacterized protein n=1 Tax=Carya illinoinensis TaxID=32201 RepID=A0A922E4I6_CARIL|nr:hypothetical protein I3842_09G110100 [Carya illinoinensis]KAG7963263.1 hypothetical protein I3843_09G110200 [Carya illinoinensis]
MLQVPHLAFSTISSSIKMKMLTFSLCLSLLFSILIFIDPSSYAADFQPTKLVNKGKATISRGVLGCTRRLFLPLPRLTETWTLRASTCWLVCQIMPPTLLPTVRPL